MSTDKLDALIAKKEAEYETLSRSTAAMLEAHEAERERFKQEMADKRVAAKKELDNELKEKKKFLIDTTKLLNKATSELEKKQTAIESAKNKSLSELSSIQDEKQLTESIVSTLKTEELSLNSEIEIKKGRITKLNADVEILMSRLADLTAKEQAKQHDISVLDDDIKATSLEFDLLKSNLKKEIKDTKDTLSLIRSELNQAQRSLVDVQKQEESVRQDIADRYMDIQNREESVTKRENQVRISEKRVYNYQQFTKL